MSLDAVQTQVLTAADIERLGTETKATFIESLPGIVATYIGLVRASGDAETMRKAAELGFKVHGGIVEEKKNASSLPMVNIVIDMTRGTMQMTQTQAAEQADSQDIIELQEAFDLLDAQRRSTASAAATDFLSLLPLIADSPSA
jgi:hypothetical protein